MKLLGRLIGRRPSQRTPETRTPTNTARAVALLLADTVMDSANDTADLTKLRALARLWRTHEELLHDELVALDTYAVEYALARVLMIEPLRVELREEFQAALASMDVDLETLRARHGDYAARLAADRRLALSGGSVRGIASSAGAVFTQALGGENALLADAVGRRFIDHTEALREYLEGAVKELGGA